jgi:septal ring-binding cell division protein DamX
VAPAGRSKVPFIAIAVGGVLVATIAAWYFLLRTPAAPPTDVASATPAPPPVTAAEAPTPAATAASPAAEPTAPPSLEPTPAPTPTPRAGPTATPAPTPTPRATPVAPPAGGDARALLAQGALPDAARAFAAALAPRASGRFSLQVLVACAPENVQKAVAAVPAEDLFILPVTVKGRDCYRMCWGVYDSRPAAEAALSGLPPYFRQGGASPRVSPLAELLP